jgi:hypothetical protein
MSRRRYHPAHLTSHARRNPRDASASNGTISCTQSRCLFIGPQRKIESARPLPRISRLMSFHPFRTSHTTQTTHAHRCKEKGKRVTLQYHLRRPLHRSQDYITGGRSLSFGVIVYEEIRRLFDFSTSQLWALNIITPIIMAAIPSQNRTLTSDSSSFLRHSVLQTTPSKQTPCHLPSSVPNSSFIPSPPISYPKAEQPLTSPSPKYDLPLPPPQFNPPREE